MKPSFSAMVPILFGVYAVAASGMGARFYVRLNERLFGKNYNEKAFKIAFQIGGLLFVVVGLLQLFGIIGTPP